MKLSIALFLSSLGLAAPSESATLPLLQPETADKVEMVDIGGRKLRLLTRGQGAPTVVIEAGMGAPGAGDPEWRKVIEEISKTNRVCIYDRAGLGKSDPPKKLPRTSLDVADDLNALLAKAKVPGPYLLVAHSYGGLHARMFADRYPEQLLGLVLVDSTHPDMDRQLIDMLGAPKPGEPESVAKGREFLTRRISDPNANPEKIDANACNAQVRALNGIGAKPAILLTHSSKFRVDGRLPEEVSLKIEEIFQSLQVDLKKISTNSTLKQSVTGGHGLHADDPDFVIQGIREGLEAVKKQAK